MAAAEPVDPLWSGLIALTGSEHSPHALLCFALLQTASISPTLPVNLQGWLLHEADWAASIAKIDSARLPAGWKRSLARLDGVKILLLLPFWALSVALFSSQSSALIAAWIACACITLTVIISLAVVVHDVRLKQLLHTQVAVADLTEEWSRRPVRLTWRLRVVSGPVWKDQQCLLEVDCVDVVFAPWQVIRESFQELDREAGSRGEDYRLWRAEEARELGSLADAPPLVGAELRPLPGTGTPVALLMVTCQSRCQLDPTLPPRLCPWVSPGEWELSVSLLNSAGLWSSPAMSFMGRFSTFGTQWCLWLFLQYFFSASTPLPDLVRILGSVVSFGWLLAVWLQLGLGWWGERRLKAVVEQLHRVGQEAGAHGRRVRVTWWLNDSWYLMVRVDDLVPVPLRLSRLAPEVQRREAQVAQARAGGLTLP